MTRAESVAVATEARRAKTITAAECRARLAYVEQLLVDDVAHREIVRRCRERFGMGEGAVERVKSRVFTAWTAQDRELRDLRRAQQRRRLVKLIRTTSKAKSWRAAVAGETLLAKIDGTIVTPRPAARTDGDLRHEMICRALASRTDEEIGVLADSAGEEEP